MADSTPLSRRAKLEAWRKERRMRLERAQEGGGVGPAGAPHGSVATSATPMSVRLGRTEGVERTAVELRSHGKEEEAHRLRQALREAEERRQEVQGRLEEKDRENARLMGELEGLRKAVEAWETWESRATQDIKAELQEARDRERKLEREMAIMEAGAAQTDKETVRLREECKNMHEQLQEIGARHREREEKTRKKLEEAEKNVEELQDENRKLKKASSTSRNHGSAMSREEMDSLQATAAAAQQELIDLIQQKKGVEADLNKWIRAADGHQAELRMKEKNIRSLQGEVEKAERLVWEKEQELERMREESSQGGAAEALATLEEKLQEQEEWLAEEKAENERLRLRLAKVTSEKEELSDRHHALDSELQEAVDGQRAAEELVEGIRLEAAIEGEELRAEISRMDTLLEEAKKEIEALQQRLQEAHVTVHAHDHPPNPNIASTTPCSAESQKSASHHIESLKARLSRVLSHQPTDSMQRSHCPVQEEDQVAVRLGFGTEESHGAPDGRHHRGQEETGETHPPKPRSQAMAEKVHADAGGHRPARKVLGRIDNLNH